MVEIRQSVGDRIVVNQKGRLLSATVRYTGTLPEKDGEWYGIQYDEPYGKHDGTHEGVQYFKCVPKYGSFVRPPKVLTSVTLEDAIKMQYKRDVQMEAKIGEMNSSKIFIKEKPLDQLKSISVTDLPVDNMPSDTLPTMCPNVKSFDCSNTKISTWTELKVAISKTKITHLTVSRLKLIQVEEIIFETVENLIVCNCDYATEDLQKISKMFPNLKALNLSGNKIENIRNVELPKKLDFLDISRNPKLGVWSDIVQGIRPLSRLRELNLTKCSLSDLLSKGVILGSIEILILSENPINSLTSFNDLNCTVPNVKALSVRDVTVAPDDDPTARQEIIARMSSITSLNRTVIPNTDAEVHQTGVRLVTRRGAEIDYLNRLANSWYDLDPEKVPEWHHEHPRWNELIKLHGEPIRLKKIETKLNSKMFKITLRGRNGEEIQKELLKTTKIKNIQVMFKKLFKTKVKDRELFVEDGMFCLDNSDWTLDDSNIKDGDVILVQ